MIPKELLARNLAYRGMVCSVYLKEVRKVDNQYYLYLLGISFLFVFNVNWCCGAGVITSLRD